MIRWFIEDLATLVAITLVVGCISVWAAILS